MAMASDNPPSKRTFFFLADFKIDQGPNFGHSSPHEQNLVEISEQSNICLSKFRKTIVSGLAVTTINLLEKKVWKNREKYQYPKYNV